MADFKTHISHGVLHQLQILTFPFSGITDLLWAEGEQNNLPPQTHVKHPQYVSDSLEFRQMGRVARGHFGLTACGD